MESTSDRLEMLRDSLRFAERMVGVTSGEQRVGRQERVEMLRAEIAEEERRLGRSQTP